jgi:predicted permease
LLVGWQGSRLFWVLKPPFFSSNSVDLSIDGRVLAFTFAVSILTGLLFGLAPALQASKTDVNTSLREKSNQQPGGSLMTQRFFLLFQVAFSVVALVVAGLLVRSLREMRHIDLGFESQKLMVLGFSLGAQGYEGPRGLEFQRRMRERVESVPGVHSAGFATHQPLTDGSFRRTIFPEGQGTGAGLTGAFVLTNLIGTGYLESSGIRLISGRDFKDSDTMDAPKVAIVNESLAKHLWPGQDVVGKRFKFFNENDFVQIVGVLKDSKLISLTEEPRPCVYTPLGQTYVSDVTLYVRTEANPISVFHEVEGEIRSLDPALPIVDPRMITSVIEQSLWAPRLGAELVAGFGIVALLLVAVGIYGILAYATGQRREEISIRMALGAQQGSILMLVLKQGIVLVLIGTGLGLVFGFFAGYLVSNLLFGVRATDPISFLFVTIMLVVVAALASLIPARRATKIAPMFALR